jgi:hypothetical protein
MKVSDTATEKPLTTVLVAIIVLVLYIQYLYKYVLLHTSNEQNNDSTRLHSTQRDSTDSLVTSSWYSTVQVQYSVLLWLACTFTT